VKGDKGIFLFVIYCIGELER